MNRLESIRQDLILMALHESNKLWRLSRIAEEHSLSNECINNIIHEAVEMTNIASYPERLLDKVYMSRYKYAFKY